MADGGQNAQQAGIRHHDVELAPALEDGRAQPVDPGGV